METYLIINESENAVDSLLRAEEFILRAEKSTEPARDNGVCWGAFHWKWVIICLQNSLYTFGLTVAAGTNPNIVKTKKGKVVNLITALKYCIGRKRFTHSQPVEFTRNQKNSILWLQKEFRNQFEHFSLLSWMIDLKGMPNICIDVLEAIRILSLDSGNILYSGKHYSHKEKERKMEQSINRSVKVLRSSSLYMTDDQISEFPGLDKKWKL